MHRIRTIFIVVVTILSCIVIRPVQATPLPVNQGDSLIVAQQNNLTALCSAGFIDAENNRIWTAGHCGNHGATVYNSQHQKIGTLVYRWPDIVNGFNAATTPEERNKAIAQFFPYDIAYVQLDNPEFAGTNLYSGSRVYTPTEGDRVCMYGARTQTVRCGLILKIDDYFIYAVDLGSQPGDSGGPTWVPGKGYTGQILGARTIIRTSDKKEATTILIHRHDIAEMQTKYDSENRYTYPNPRFQDIWDNPSTASDRLTEFGRELPNSAEYAELIAPLEETQSKKDAAANREKSATERIAEIEALWAELTAKQEQKQQLEAEIAQQNHSNQQRETQLAELNNRIKDLQMQLDQAENAKIQAEITEAKKTESELGAGKHPNAGSSESNIFLSILGIVLAVVGFFAPHISRLLHHV